jgi:hypothetical protein
MALQRLTDDEFRRVRALRAARGLEGAARALGISEVTVESILSGSPVMAATAQRVRNALATLGDAPS